MERTTDSGQLRARADRIYDEAAPSVRAGQLGAEGVAQAAQRIEDLAQETTDEVVTEEIRAVAASLRELPQVVRMDGKFEPVRHSKLLDQADALRAWGYGIDIPPEARLERIQDAYRQLKALPRGNDDEEHAISAMVNELAERIHEMGGDSE